MADPAVLLVHSPLTGPGVWEPVAHALHERAVSALVADLSDDGSTPFWRQHVRAVVATVAASDVEAVTLVGHSGAGPLLAAVAEAIPATVAATVYVDAGLPRDGATRLELLYEEVPRVADDLREHLERGGRFPTWTDDDLAEILPDLGARRRVIDGLRPRGLEFWTEPIPAPTDWREAPIAYLRFSDTYEYHAEVALRHDRPVVELDAGHFHMLVEPGRVADLLLRLAADATPR